VTLTGGALLSVRERGREWRWAGAAELGQAGPRWEEKKEGECWAAWARSRTGPRREREGKMGRGRIWVRRLGLVLFF
jgi:nicotinamide mononucleotide (NMN) deamidase PncC